MWAILKAIKKENDKYEYRKLGDSDTEPIDYPSYGEYLDGRIVIDVDNKNAEQIVDDWLAKYDVRTRKEITKHGAHYWFTGKLPNGTTQRCYKLACGVLADIRIKEWITMKRDKVMYESNGVTDIAELPRFMLPVQKSNVKAEETWLEAKNLSRNNSLRDAMLLLSKYFDTDALAQMIRDINELTLDEPLPKSELESTVLRKESLEFCEHNSGGYNKTDYIGMAEYIHNTLPIVGFVVSRNEDLDKVKLYAFDGTAYQPADATIGKLIREICPEATIQTKREVISAFKDMYDVPARYITDFDFNEYTPFLNGCLNTITGEWTDNLPEHHNRLAILHEYNSDFDTTCYEAKCVDDFMDCLTLGRKDLEGFLWLYLGLCMAKSTILDKVVYLYGPAGNLKSTFFAMVDNLFKYRNGSVPLGTLLSDHGTANMLDAYLIYYTEAFKGKLDDAIDLYKALASQDVIDCNPKNVKQFQYRPIGKMMYATNQPVKSGINDDAVDRREIYLPMDWAIGKYRNVSIYTESVSTFKTFLNTNEVVGEYAAYKAVNALIEFIKSGKSIDDCIPQCAHDLSNKIRLERDSVALWLKCADDFVSTKTPCQEVYSDYQKWCYEEGHQAVSRQIFTRTLTKYGYTNEGRRRVSGKQIRFYQKL